MMDFTSQQEADVDPRREDVFNVDPKKLLICYDGLHMVNQGPNFRNNNSLVAIFWLGLLRFCIPEEAQAELLGFLHYARLLMQHESNCRETPVSAFYLWAKNCPHPVSSAQLGGLIHIKQI